MIKHYTISDTQVYGKPNSSADFKLSEPFVTGILFKVSHVLLMGTVKYGLNEEFIPYKIKNPFGFFERKIFQIENSKQCGDTVYVNIDVK